jgi:hypothetical protein
LLLVPSRYPENIRGVAVTTTSMSFEWDRILPGFVHGILIEYNLTVRETDNFDNVIVSSKIRHPERSYYIEGLKKYTNYTMWVSVINSKGEGPVYLPGRINSTGEDGKNCIYLFILFLYLALPITPCALTFPSLETSCKPLRRREGVNMH